MRTWIATATLAALAATAPNAAAQTDGQTGPTGTVPSLYELTISPPEATLSRFAKARTYSTSFDVAVTTSEARAHLSLADGDVASGKRRGRLANGSKLLPLPLEARVGRAPFAPLTVDTPLARLTGPVSNRTATVKLRQRVEDKTKGRYGKLLLVTLSADIP